MDLHKPSASNSLAKRLAPILSRLLTGNRRIKLVRSGTAYANFLIGKGCGTGWNLAAEVHAARQVIFRDDPVVFDVGGNVGQWSAIYRSISDKGHVYIFEPQPPCQAEIRALNLPGVTLIPACAGDQPGTAKLHTSNATDVTATLHRRDDSFFTDWQYATIDVPVVTLDGIIEEKQIPFVDFMKMDIEGHELFALKGMQRSLDAGKVGAFSFEFSSGNLNSRSCFRDFWQLLSPKFEILRITPSDRLIRVEQYYEDLEHFRGGSNYIALLKNHPYATAGQRPRVHANER